MDDSHHSTDVLSHHLNNSKAAIGAVIQVFQELAWTLYDLSPHPQWQEVFQINGASQSEKIEVLFLKKSLQISSSTIGIHKIHGDENIKNLELFRQHFETCIDEKSEAELIHSYQKFLKKENLLEDGNGIRKIKFSDKNFFQIAKEAISPGSSTFVTSWLCIVNIVVFFISVLAGANIFDPDSSIMISLGANYTKAIMAGEYWRFVSSCFLHFGLAHLLSNMIALIFAGMILEHLIGGRFFLFVYLMCGIFASATSFFVHEFTISAGASGAIFGIYGFMIGLVTTNFLQKEYRTRLGIYLLLYIGLNMAGGIMKEGIDNAAHLGGLLSGILYSWISISYVKNRDNTQRAIIAYIGILLLTLSYSISLIKYKPYIVYAAQNIISQ